MKHSEIEVVDVEEHDDGSATYTFNVPQSLVNAVMEKTLLDVIQRYLDGA